MASMARFHLAVCVLAIATLGMGSGAAHCDVNRIFVLGDSLSDNGIIYQLTQGFLGVGIPQSKFGYVKGRFSNGPMWMDFLTSCTGAQVSSFAAGGATSCNTPNFLPLIPSLQQQLGVYLNVTAPERPARCPAEIEQWPQFSNKLPLTARCASSGPWSGLHKESPSSLKHDCSALVAVFSGSNDVLLALGTNSSDPPPRKVLVAAAERAARCQVQGVVKPLLKAAAPAVVVMFTLPPMELQPFLLAGTSRENARAAVEAHNKILNHAAATLQKDYPHTKVLVYDHYTFLHNLLAPHGVVKPAALPPCLVLAGGGASPADALNQNVVSKCKDVSKVVTWDNEGHYTTHTNELIAVDFVKFLQRNGVELPAATKH